MSVIWITILVVGGIGVLAACLLYIAANKFRVVEDPRIDEIEALLPGANCGGCGRKGCRDFATACAGASSLENLVCPGCGAAVMRKIADIVGLAPAEYVPKVAQLRCNGSCSMRKHINTYDGVTSCAIEASFYAGETACAYGCLGCGDCVSVCRYDALHIDAETALPVVDDSKCVGCGKCVTTCPRTLFTLVPKKENQPRVWVACMNRDKGPIAMKECDAACIGCGKCVRICAQKAVTVGSFVAKINPELCVGCGACADACPRKSILSTELTFNQKQYS